MSGRSSVDWATCSNDECPGIRLQTGAKCLAHADSKDLDAELKRLAEEGTIDARGVTISAELLKRILGAAPHDAQQPARPRLNKATFDGAGFGESVQFRDTIFGDGASFLHATFGNGASFSGVTFGNGASFDGASFADNASFLNATFGRSGARFSGATFGKGADFRQVRFGGGAWFRGASLGGGSSFIDATRQTERSDRGGPVDGGPVTELSRTMVVAPRRHRAREHTRRGSQVGLRWLGHHPSSSPVSSYLGLSSASRHSTGRHCVVRHCRAGRC